MNSMTAKALETQVVPGNVYFFTGRRLDAFDFSSGGGASGGGAAASSGGGLLGGLEATSSADVSFWLCFYSSLGGAKNPLDFDGDGDIDENDLTWLDKCISAAGGSTESTSAPAPLLPAPLAGGSAMASAGSTAGLVLYHYRARAHDPGLGRFMQRDPIGLIDGTNRISYTGSYGPKIFGSFSPRNQYSDDMSLYQYAFINPLTGDDPRGMQTTIGPTSPTTMCAYYDNLADSEPWYAVCRKTYLRLAASVCRLAGTGTWSCCVRKCLMNSLQKKGTNLIPCLDEIVKDLAFDHISCFVSCAL